MTLLGFVVAVLIVGILFWCVQRMLMAFAIGEPISTIVYVVFLLLVVIWLVGAVTGRGWVAVF